MTQHEDAFQLAFHLPNGQRTAYLLLSHQINNSFTHFDQGKVHFSLRCACKLSCCSVLDFSIMRSFIWPNDAMSYYLLSLIHEMEVIALF